MKPNILTWVREQWDRTAAWVAVAAGIVCLIVGWIGVSGTPYTAKQVPYLASAGFGSLFLLGLGAMLWLSADLRDEWRKLDEIQDEIRAHGPCGIAETLAEAERLKQRAPEDSVRR